MKIVQLLVITLFFGLTAQAQQYSLVEQNGRYGYSFQGKVIIPATFEYATHFSEGRALVKQNNLWGYIDSTGQWIVEPTFQTASLFKGGIATVFVNGKMGLLKADGSYKVKPIYDTLIEEYYGVQVVVNGKKGWISNDWEEQIPAEYQLFSFAYDYVSAKKANAGYDLYYRGRLIKTNMENALSYSDVHVDAKQVTASVDGKKGILDQEGNWIIEPVYSNIMYHFLGDYFDDHFTNTPALYVLDSTQYMYFDDLHEMWEQYDVTKLFIAKTTGEVITKTPAETFEIKRAAQGNVTRVEIRLNGKIAYIQSDFSIKETPYTSIREYYNWQLLNDGEREHLVDYRGNEIATFDAVSVPETGIPVYDDYGEPTGEYVEADYAPYMEVMNVKDSVEQWAVYELEEQKIITAWTAERHAITYFPQEETNRLYVDYRYVGDTASCDYYIAGSKGIMNDYSYSRVTPIINNLVIVQNNQQDEMVLLHTSPEKGLREVLKAPFIEVSTNLNDYSFVPSEVEGYYDPIPVTRFNEAFVFYKGANGKCGLVTNDNTVIPAIYDTMVQNPFEYYVLDVQQNGKWGSIDVHNGNTFAPIYNEPLAVVYNPVLDLLYTTFEDHYLASNGAVFYTLNPELIPFKNKGKCGMLSYNDFLGDGSTVVAIPPVYKSISQPFDFKLSFIAQNKKGMYGIINQLNDTIVPFIYKSIKPFDFEFWFAQNKKGMYGIINHLNDTIVPFIYTGFGEELHFKTELGAIETFIGKKKGFVYPWSIGYIPAVYDKITILFDANGYETGIQVFSNGKTGLYSLALDLISPLE